MVELDERTTNGADLGDEDERTKSPATERLVLLVQPGGSAGGEDESKCSLYVVKYCWDAETETSVSMQTRSLIMAGLQCGGM